MSVGARSAGSSVVPKTGTLRRRENIEGWLLASPWIIGFLVWTIGPMVFSAYYSFTEFDLISRPEWVGLRNYAKILTRDARTLHALKITTVYSVFSVPLRMLLALVLALLLNTKIRGLEWYRTVYYLPAVLSGVAVALLWKWVFSAEFGLLNLALSWFGIRGPAWLADQAWALPALILMSLWGIGGGMVIYLAGLQGIPVFLYEAARIDGANTLQQFFTITIPMMTPVIFFNLVMGVIRTFQIFTQAYIMTQGGPGRATYFYVYYLYRNSFDYYRMGYGAAMAWFLFAVILALTMLNFWLGNKWVFYEGGEES